MSEPRIWRSVCAAGIIATGCIASAHARDTLIHADTAPVTAGWIETAWLAGHALALDAKLDTGADTSSINAGSFETFSKDSRQWVRFQLKGRDGETRVIEAPVLRTARIRRAGAGVTERPVILLSVCVAGRSGEAEFTLADRTGMDFAMLIGRGFLAGRLMVDSARTRVGDGACAATPRKP